MPKNAQNNETRPGFPRRKVVGAKTTMNKKLGFG
jgi:hypothetical protein